MNKQPVKAIILFAFVFLPQAALAAGSLSIIPSVKKAAPGQEFTVTVRFDGGDSTVNAISGAVSLDRRLSVRALLDGHSMLPVWIERPAVSADGSISFAGIVPGGVYGGGELFSFVAAASTTGAMTIGARDIQALAQGQDPKPISVKVMPATVSVSGAASSSAISLDDTVAPEPFTVSIGRDSRVFDGAPFAAFSAVDKQTGIAGYEASFTYLLRPGDGDWRPVQSPYRIPPEGNGKLVWIRALDAAGNATVARASGPGYNRNIAILAILIVILLCLAHFARQRALSRPPSSYRGPL